MGCCRSSTAGPTRPPPVGRAVLAGALMLFLGMAGCRSLPQPPPINLADPGWMIWEGQAVWYPPEAQTSLAGHLMVAVHENGSSWVQFSKPPFPLVEARRLRDGWRLEWIAQNRATGGKGPPPARWIWFQLAARLTKEAPSGPWTFARVDPDRWRLENGRTGERLEGYLKLRP